MAEAMTEIQRCPMTISQQDRQSLRAAIASALQIADAQNDHLVAALLAHALAAAEHDVSE